MALAFFIGTVAFFPAEPRPLSRQFGWPFSPEYPPELTSHVYADIYFKQFTPAFNVSSEPVGGTIFGYLPIEFYASVKLKASCYDDCTEEKWVAIFNIDEVRLYIDQFPVYFNPWKLWAKVINMVRVAANNQDKISALTQKAVDEYEKSGKSATTLCNLKKN